MTTRELKIALKIGICIIVIPLLFSCTQNKGLTKEIKQESTPCFKEGNKVELDSSYNFSIHTKSHSSDIYQSDSVLVIHKAVGSYHQNERIGQWDFFVDEKLVKRIQYRFKQPLFVEYYNYHTGKVFRKLYNNGAEFEVTEYDDKGLESKKTTYPIYLSTIEKNGID